MKKILLTGVFNVMLFSLSAQLTNVALHKNVSVDSEYRAPENTGSMAVDGVNDPENNDSRWVSGPGDPHYIIIDLESYYMVKKVAFYTGHDGYGFPLDSYQIQYWDGENWIDMVSRTGNKGTQVTEQFNEAYSTNKVRLYVTKTSDGIVRLYEVEVYGSADSIADAGGSEYWQMSESGVYLNEGLKVGIGTSQLNDALNVAGTIHAKKIQVDLQVAAPDYVFDQEYELISLEELQVYIDENHHLPETPSAAVMEEQGISLVDMNMLLLKKVEELTLYNIALNERLKQLEAQIADK